MPKLEKILCPVDFSEFAARAYYYARSLAQHYKAALVVQHVTEPLLSIYRGYMTAPFIEDAYLKQESYAEQELHEFIARYNGPGDQPELVLQRGPVAESVLSLAAERNVDLIVMGTHGRRGFDHLVLGSVAERVLRKASCPVLVIRDPTRTFVDAGNREDPVNIQSILFCTDFDDNSPRALEYALSLALQYSSGISLLHVIEAMADVPGLAEEIQLVQQQLEESIPEDARRWAKVVSTVRTGKPSKEIIDYASEIHADLIVMGVRGRGAVDLTLFGSTTHRVIQLATCPVLVVRT